jgi:hypothetical protein
MLDLLFYVNISCTDAAKIIGRIDKMPYMNMEEKVEVVEVIQESNPHCKWDAND